MKHRNTSNNNKRGKQMNRLENTKEIKTTIEKELVAELKEVIAAIEKNGYNSKTDTKLRFLESHVNEYNVITHFFNAWHSEGTITKGM